MAAVVAGLRQGGAPRLAPIRGLPNQEISNYHIHADGRHGSRWSRVTRDSWLLPCVAIAAAAHRCSGRAHASVFLASGRRQKVAVGLARRQAVAETSVQQGADYKVGDDVEARLPDEGHWYRGVISSVKDPGTVEVTWDDPTADDEKVSSLSVDDVRRVEVFKDYQVGDQVDCLYLDEGYLPAEVIAVNGDGTFQVRWEEGSPEESTCSYRDMEYPPLSNDEVEVGQKYKATVESVQKYGAFVNYGAEECALVPKACMVPEDKQVDPSDVVEVGQEIDIWILKIQADGKVAATMVNGAKAPPTFEEIMARLDSMDRDEWIPARVFRLRQSFADIYVSIVDDFETRGSIHISQLSEDFVDSVEDVVQEGQEVQVKFLRVSERSQFDFTLLDSPRSSRPQRTPQSERHSSSPPDRRERSPPPRRQPARVESFAELDDMWFTGTVSGVQSFGAFVDIKHPVSGDQATGLVHVSQLADDYVESASDVVSVGEQVECWIVNVDTHAGKIALSMRTS